MLILNTSFFIHTIINNLLPEYLLQSVKKQRTFPNITQGYAIKSEQQKRTKSISKTAFTTEVTLKTGNYVKFKKYITRSTSANLKCKDN